MRPRAHIFARNDRPRPGGLFDYLVANADDGSISRLSSCRSCCSISGRSGRRDLHSAACRSAIAGGTPPSSRRIPTNLVPLHKLSQWLAYSLIEPLQQAGLAVTDIDGLTGLAEYRNGGLFVDTDVLALRDAKQAVREHDVGSELVVEWRALTVALLDLLAGAVRGRLKLDAAALPLAKLLEAEVGRRAGPSPSRAAPMARPPSRSSATARSSEHGTAIRAGEKATQGVTIVDHPLVQHKLTLIRDKNRSAEAFRELLAETGMLLCYEVTRDLPLTKVEVQTPLTPMMSPRIAGKKLVFAPILRFGIIFAEGMLDFVPAARVAHIGLYREPKTFGAVEYYSRRRRISPNALSSWLHRCSRPAIRRLPQSIG